MIPLDIYKQKNKTKKVSETKTHDHAQRPTPASPPPPTFPPIPVPASLRQFPPNILNLSRIAGCSGMWHRPADPTDPTHHYP